MGTDLKSQPPHTIQILRIVKRSAIKAGGETECAIKQKSNCCT